MNLKVIKSKSGYKIISNSNHKHPALIALGALLVSANKFSEIKIGIYNVFGGEFETHKTVYSYISTKSEKMNKKQYRKWIRGDRQIYIPKIKQWTEDGAEKEINELLESVK